MTEDDIEAEAAIHIATTIEKNAEYAGLKIVASGFAFGAVAMALGASLVAAFGWMVLLCAVREAKHEIMQHMRHAELAGIYRKRPDLVQLVGETVTAMRSDGKIWRSLSQ